MHIFDLVLLQSQIEDANNCLQVITIIKEIVAILGIIIGLIIGREGIRRYLRNDIIKNKFAELNRANNNVAKYSIKIISDIYSSNEKTRPLTIKDLKILKNYTQELVNISYNSSRDVATLCFFLNETIIHIQPKYEKFRKISLDLHEIQALVYLSSKKINQISTNIIDIPKKIDTEKHDEIKESVRKFLKKGGYKKIKNIQFGVGLSPKSDLAILFSSIINKSTTQFFYKKYFFQTLGDNYPIILELLVNKIYFPIILESKEVQDMLFFKGKLKMHLIMFQFRTIRSSNDIYKSIDFYYSNIDRLINFVDNLEVEEFKRSYQDSFNNEVTIFNNGINKIEKYPEQTMKIECRREFAEKLFLENEKMLIERIKEDKK